MREAVMMLDDGRLLAYPDMAAPVGPVAMCFHGALTSRLEGAAR